ncbi:hypothetical protein L6164_016838 [Bauhinia variegata]|uniref:Uncharacterized protein n=1 Tax=Bauhinia variegata TaxID=167791 RepID=A0ACB9N5Q5_BAUVA|nr:hypothetical protein L6164_016838 [Bauhinia variegata]
MLRNDDPHIMHKPPREVPESNPYRTLIIVDSGTYSYSVGICASNFTAYNISFKNSAPPRFLILWQSQLKARRPVDPMPDRSFSVISVLEKNLEGHVKRCPFLKQAESLSLQPFYQKGINAGDEGEQEEKQTLAFNDSRLPNIPNSSPLDNISSEMKRNAVHAMTLPELCNLIEKIESVHELFSKDIEESYQMPETCNLWIKREVEERKLPFQEKHVFQQASILGNLEISGVLNTSQRRKLSECEKSDKEEDGVPAVIEFGAGRGYLTQMLVDCYGIKRVFLVERKSYKLKADRSLRQNERVTLERLRIDIEDLDLSAVESLKGVSFLAIGKHLCGPATDLTMRCCFPEYRKDNNEHYNANKYFQGLAIATCCHHLCQWKHYINKKFFLNLGMTKEDFHAITWFTSWAVDANHDSDLADIANCRSHLQSMVKEKCDGYESGAEKVLANVKAVEPASLGFTFKCKRIIDMGRLMWLRERGLDSQLLRYVPLSISPENHLLIAKSSNPVSNLFR